MSQFLSLGFSGFVSFYKKNSGRMLQVKKKPSDATRGGWKILKNYRLAEKRAGGHRWKEKKIGTRQQLSVINFFKKGTEVYLCV